MIHRGLTGAKAFIKDVFINQERKLGDRRRLDTVVVLFYCKRSRLRIGSLVLRLKFEVLFIRLFLNLFHRSLKLSPDFRRSRGRFRT